MGHLSNKISQANQNPVIQRALKEYWNLWWNHLWRDSQIKWIIFALCEFGTSLISFISVIFEMVCASCQRIVVRSPGRNDTLFCLVSGKFRSDVTKQNENAQTANFSIIITGTKFRYIFKGGIKASCNILIIIKNLFNILSFVTMDS